MSHAELQAKAERRGRIDHPEGARYETASWDDVLALLAECDVKNVRHQGLA